MLADKHANSSAGPGKPVCSVCIANYNGIGVIENCLKSLLAQQCDFEYEVIVHDDASTDGSTGFIRNNHPDVRLITSGENVGFCVSNNRMAAAARGEYVLLLNNDAELFQDALHVLHEEAMKQGRPCILGLPQYDAATGMLIDRGSLFDPFLNPVPNLDRNLGNVGMVTGACLWLPRKLWEDLGGFPDWFWSVAEDAYLCCLARLRGYSVRVAPLSGFKHHIGNILGGGKIRENRLVTSVRRRALSERNKNFVMVIAYPPPLFQIIFPLHIASLFLEGVLLSLIKRNAALLKNIYLASMKALWQERAKLLRLRRVIQPARRISCGQFLSVFRIAPHKLKMMIKYGIPEIH